MVVLTSPLLDGLCRRDRLIHGAGNWGPPLPWTPASWRGYVTRGAPLAEVFGYTRGVRQRSSCALGYAYRILAAVDRATAGTDPGLHPVIMAVRAAHGMATSERGVDFNVAHLYALPEWRALYDPA